MHGGSTVEWRRLKINRASDFASRRSASPIVDPLRLSLRLIHPRGALEYRFDFPWVLPSLNTTAHRIVQQINGRDYRIEVTQLTSHRWRAQVLNAYGGPTALMPFYDATADEALSRLTDWLSRAHRSVANPA